MIDRDYVVSVTYAVERKPTNTSRLFPIQVCSPHLYSILTRLLEFTIGKGIEEAISTLDRFSCPKGVHSLFRHIVLLEGINVRKPTQVAKGVRINSSAFWENHQKNLRSIYQVFSMITPVVYQCLLIKHYLSLTVLDSPYFTNLLQPPQIHPEQTQMISRMMLLHFTLKIIRQNFPTST